MVKPMQFTHTNLADQTYERVRLRQLVKAEKNTATLNEEFEVLSAKEGQDVERMEFGVRSVSASGDVNFVKLAMSFSISEEEGEVLPRRKDKTSVALRNDAVSRLLC